VIIIRVSCILLESSKRDLQFYLRNKANCTATDINYFVNTFQGLMTECTETEFDQVWISLKGEKRFHSNHVVLNYFESNLLPAFKMHSSIWVLKFVVHGNSVNSFQAFQEIHQ